MYDHFRSPKEVCFRKHEGNTGYGNVVYIQGILRQGRVRQAESVDSGESVLSQKYAVAFTVPDFLRNYRKFLAV